MTNLPPVIKIVPMPGIAGIQGTQGLQGVQGPSGNGSGVSSTVPFELNDTNDDLLLSITKTGTGTTRIETPQDDLSLRSARDITLFAGNDGPGKVYIGWGDANYTPTASNEVATLGDIDETVSNAINNIGLYNIKTRIWAYPTEGAVAIMPETDNESIALKSSDSAAIRWHVRNNGSSAAGAGQLFPTSAQVVQGDGVFIVTFTFPEENSVPTTTQHNYYVSAPNSPSFDGAFLPQSATSTTLSLIYDTDPGVFDPTNSYINQPSVYSQFEVDENGAHIKLANWSDGQGASYSQTWDFTKEGAIHFPYGYSNNRTGYGDILRFASSVDQAIITGPAATESNPNANRLVIAGQDGATGIGYDGEGGDIYVWAGRGGGTNGDGGDVKIDGGNGSAGGQGGYVKVRGGDADNAQGGFIEISAGSSYNNNGGTININGGPNYNSTGSFGGTININGGTSGDSALGGAINLNTYQSGKITISGAGGEFLNDSSNPNNQIATIGDLPTGATGSFISQDGKTITVSNGIITDIV